MDKKDENSTSLSLISAAYDSSSDECEEEEEEKSSTNDCGLDEEKRRIDSEIEDEIKQSVLVTLEYLVNCVSLMTPAGPRHTQSDNHSFIKPRPSRDDSQIDISSSSSSFSSSSDSELEDEDIIEEHSKNLSNYKRRQVVTKGELSITDLPPIENLSVTVMVEELTQLGRVVSVVDELVVIQSFKGLPALDLDSILFYKDGTPIGSIFDVFGPVVEPRYSIRFNTNDDINAKHIQKDMPIYFAAAKEKPITGFVFAEQLRQMKGSDASWKHNNEPPEGVKEYSDDEEERKEKLKHRAKSRSISNPKTPPRGRGRARGYWQSHKYNNNHNQSPFRLPVPPNTPTNPENYYHAQQIQMQMQNEMMQHQFFQSNHPNWHGNNDSSAGHINGNPNTNHWNPHPYPYNHSHYQ